MWWLTALEALAAFGPGMMQVMSLKMLGSEGTGYLSGALAAWEYAVNDHDGKLSHQDGANI